MPYRHIGKRIKIVYSDSLVEIFHKLECLAAHPREKRKYFFATSGNITDEMIMEYIKNQDNNEKEDGEFTIVD